MHWVLRPNTTEGEGPFFADLETGFGLRVMLYDNTEQYQLVSS